MQFATIEEALKDIKKGRFVIVVDSQDRENEGDLIISAEHIDVEKLKFLIYESGGVVCVAICQERLNQLQIEPMVREPSDVFKTPFCVSVDYKYEIKTGVSIPERIKTIKALIDENTKPEDFVKPGHVFPLAAKTGGVLERAGHTEAGVDLCRLAGLYPAAVIAEILSESGESAKLLALFEFAKKYNLKIITIADLIKYRMKREKLIKREIEVNLPTAWGEFKLIYYSSKIDKKIYLALVKGEIENNQSTLVRVHSQCLTGEVFNSLRCDCGKQLELALEKIAKEGGVFLYLPQEGRDIGLLNKLKAYKLQQENELDTVEANKILGFEADLREYGIGAQILVDLGVKKMKLLTNNPRKIIGLEGFELQIEQRIPIETEPNPNNINYLKTKKEKLGHLLTI